MSSKPPRYSARTTHGVKRARTYFRGRTVNLPGAYGSPESRAAFDEIVQEWERDQALRPDLLGLVFGQFAADYMDHAAATYTKNGRPTSEVHNVRTLLRWCLRVFGEGHPVRSLHAGDVDRLRDAMVASGNYTRKSVADHVSRLRRVVRWGVARRMVPPDVVTALECADRVRRGRVGARESQPVLPVAVADVMATAPFLPRGAAGAVQFALRTGCRPGEAAIVRECDIDATGDVWEYRPETHKTEHHGRDRVVMIGPRAQRCVRDYLAANPRDYLFATSTGRAYVTSGLRTQIHRACKRAGVPAWNPNQLRHTFATQVRQSHGLEAARLLLGHSEIDTTTIYAERDLDMARRVAAELG